MARRPSNKSEPDNRYRFSVPVDDVCVVDWVSHQHNLSLSIRQLIKATIEERGMRDYFSSDAGEIVQLPKRGRPANTIERVESVIATEETAQFTAKSNERGSEKPMTLSDLPFVPEELKGVPAREEKPPLTSEQQDAKKRLEEMQSLLNS